MAWINGHETKKFSERLKRSAVAQRTAGMSESGVAAMQRFDTEVFLSNRRFYEHNQQIPHGFLETDEDGRNPLNKKFLATTSVENDMADADSRFWWIEELDNPHLARAIKSLPAFDIEVITLLAFEDYSQSDIAEMFGVNQSSICRRLQEIKKFLKKFQKHA